MWILIIFATGYQVGGGMTQVTGFKSKMSCEAAAAASATQAIDGSMLRVKTGCIEVK